MTREPPSLEHSKARMVVDDDDDLVAKAAPDLLAALKIALLAPGIHTTCQETGEPFSSTIKAAIAKAEGRA